MIKYHCGCTRDDGDNSRTYNAKNKCHSCMSKLFGKRVEFIRFGEMPESGLSINYAENKYESGVSCYLVENNNIVGTVRSEFEDRKIIRGTAIAIDTGSDDELIIDMNTVELHD